MNMTEQEVRRAFESWLSDNGEWPNAVIRSRDGYKLMLAQSAWTTWRACAKALCAAHPAQQEPVAIVDCDDNGLFIDFLHGENGSPLKYGDKLYASPVTQPGMVDDHAHTWQNTHIVGFGKGQICSQCGALRDTFGKLIPTQE